MFRYFSLAAIAGLLAPSIAHAAISLSECSAITAEINKNLPQRVDKLTTARATICAPGAKRPVLVYMMQIDASKSDAPSDLMRTFNETQLRGWCSTPSQNALMKMVNIKYIYFDRSNSFVGETILSIENCPH